ncbi:hypothetical protein CSQ92_09950 [Janthinobacterium sp. BJB446]|uniref:YcbK family protein n=1 Tax=Janthinobacterium sp. BJB446 TaxID=2048009 RepID=UPI000C11AC5C|nr:DUF882 domain-containing protein [Janthinobacterium sp. BJB446]PHV23291.1 hypothetical protein CSQ92_09950 [Janthinobacterium sp. BJB446]
MPDTIILPPPEGIDCIAQPGRRRLLLAAAGAVASIATPALAQQAGFWDLPRELWLRRPDSGEEVRAVYWADGKIVPEGYIAICQLLRDIHVNRAVQFDLVTLDIARGVYGWIRSFGVDRPLIITSGYRDPRTNASEGGVRNSLHTRAQALDLRIQGVSPEAIARFGLYLAGGGVGFYPGKRFTHLDRGRIRYWRG